MEVTWRAQCAAHTHTVRPHGPTHAAQRHRHRIDQVQKRGRECQGGEGEGRLRMGPSSRTAHVHGPCPRECIEGMPRRVSTAPRPAARAPRPRWGFRAGFRAKVQSMDLMSLGLEGL